MTKRESRTKLIIFPSRQNRSGGKINETNSCRENICKIKTGFSLFKKSMKRTQKM